MVDETVLSTSTALAARTPQITFQHCRLVQLQGPGQTHGFELREGETTVGSAPGCDVTVQNPTVSRRHFAIVRRDQTYLLRDLASTNGTFVNDLRASEVFLRPGAMIRAGDLFFRFELAYEPVELAPAKGESFGRLLGRSVAMRKIFAALEKVAPSGSTVLLTGETGTGKGAVARAVHDASPRHDGPFVVFDCAAIAPNLVESELFGHERGAFTGAVAQRKGALESASEGTLFLDELSELSLALQPKLLRALEERELTRVGSTKPIELDCRVVAATQNDLWHEVLAGRFRKDLYYRLAVVTVPLPALKEKREDIPLLVNRFLADLEGGALGSYDDLDEAFRAKLMTYDWPGNARELRNVIERASVMGLDDGPETLGAGASPLLAPAGPGPGADYELPYKDAKEKLLHAFEAEYVKRLMQRAENNVTRAAKLAGIGRKHLYALLAKHDIAGRGD